VRASWWRSWRAWKDEALITGFCVDQAQAGKKHMMASRSTPLGAVLRGIAAGAVGTVAMDLVWYARYRRGGGEDSFVDWEFSAHTKSWEDASAPAQVGKRVLEGFLQREIPDAAAAMTNDAVHWATGLQWGALYGLVAGSAAKRPTPVSGAALAAAAFTTSYVVLGLAKLYRPIWEYDIRTLAKDFGGHLAFGLGTAAVFRALDRGGR
jgi:hypothetical protein